MKKEEIYELQDGDSIALLPKEHWFKVLIKRGDPEVRTECSMLQLSFLYFQEFTSSADD